MLDTLLIAGGAVLSAPFWAHHAARTSPRVEPSVDGVEALWAANVAAPGFSLPGATLTRVGAFEHGITYRVQLVGGKQSLATVQAALPLISTGLHLPLDELVIERDPATPRDPSVLQMQVITTSPIKETVLFDRPRHEHGRILLGPHADGMGDATYRLFTRNSMWGGFVLGSIGSGKSRMIEEIALTARAMGHTAIIYVDGQDGASSSVLWRHAALRAGADDSARALFVIEQIMRDRQRYNVEHELAGFTPDPGRVGILVVVDECHVPFGKHPDRWAHIARTGRKVGVAILAADQYSDLKVFGSMEPLRSSLLAGNGYALRTNSRMAGHLLPGLDLDPYELPALPGYGYSIAAKGSDARTAPFRARYLPDRDDKADDPSIMVPSVQEWFEQVPAVQLDARARHSMDLALTALDIVAKRKAGVGTPAEVEDAVLGMFTKAAAESAATMADRILGLVVEHGGPMRLAEILAALPGANVSTVQKALKQLVERGDLVRVEHGVYAVAVAVG